MKCPDCLLYEMKNTMYNTYRCESCKLTLKIERDGDYT